jgi:opacity protein-like surface antigen
MLKSKKRLASAVFAAIACAAVSNSASAQSKFYVAGSLGIAQTTGNYTGQVQAAGQPQPGFVFISAGRDGGSDFGGRLAVGYRVIDGVAVELGYANFGKQDVAWKFEKTTGLIPPERFVTAAGRFRFDGVTLDVVGSVPLGAAFSANARLGVIAGNLRYAESQTFLNQGSTDFSASDRQTKLHWGVGAAYRVNKQLDVTADYMQAQSVGKKFAWTEEGNGRLSYGLFALGVRYSF